MPPKRSNEILKVPSQKRRRRQDKEVDTTEDNRPLLVRITKYASRAEIQEVSRELFTMGLLHLVNRAWRLEDSTMCEEFLDKIKGRSVYLDHHRVCKVDSKKIFADVYRLSAQGVLPTSFDDESHQQYFDESAWRRDGYRIHDCKDVTLRKILGVLNPIFRPERGNQVQRKTLTAVITAWKYPESEIDWAGFLHEKFQQMAGNSDKRCFLSPYLFHVYGMYGLLSPKEEAYLKGVSVTVDSRLHVEPSEMQLNDKEGRLPLSVQLETLSSEEQGAGDNSKGLERPEKSIGEQGTANVEGPLRQSGIVPLTVEEDNQGDSMLPQLDGAQPWNTSPDLTDHQFQSIQTFMTGQGNLVAQSDTHAAQAPQMHCNEKVAMFPEQMESEQTETERPRTQRASIVTSAEVAAGDTLAHINSSSLQRHDNQNFVAEVPAGDTVAQMRSLMLQRHYNISSVTLNSGSADDADETAKVGEATSSEIDWATKRAKGEKYFSEVEEDCRLQYRLCADFQRIYEDLGLFVEKQTFLDKMQEKALLSSCPPEALDDWHHYFGGEYRLLADRCVISVELLLKRLQEETLGNDFKFGAQIEAKIDYLNQETNQAVNRALISFHRQRDFLRDVENKVFSSRGKPSGPAQEDDWDHWLLEKYRVLVVRDVDARGRVEELRSLGNSSVWHILHQVVKDFDRQVGDLGELEEMVLSLRNNRQEGGLGEPQEMVLMSRYSPPGTPQVDQCNQYLLKCYSRLAERFCEDTQDLEAEYWDETHKIDVDERKEKHGMDEIAGKSVIFSALESFNDQAVVLRELMQKEEGGWSLWLMEHYRDLADGLNLTIEIASDIIAQLPFFDVPLVNLPGWTTFKDKVLSIMSHPS